MVDKTDLGRINIGCGQNPTKGWKNYDNSISIRLAEHSLLTKVLETLGLLSENHRSFISFAKANHIEWADSTKHIPLTDHSVEVLYSSHMMEHLDREEVLSFFARSKTCVKTERHNKTSTTRPENVSRPLS